MWSSISFWFWISLITNNNDHFLLCLSALSFYEANIALLPKSEKETTGWENFPRVDSLEKTLILGGIGGRRRRGRQRMRWLDGITDSMDMSSSELWSWWWTGRPGMLWFMASQRVGHDWVTELNRTALKSSLSGMTLSLSCWQTVFSAMSLVWHSAK